MPFKSDKIDFGENKNQLDAERLFEAAQNLTLALDLKRQLVGVRLLNEAPEYEAAKAPAVKGKMAYCQMVEKATRGKLYKSCLQHHSCDGGTTALALEESTPHIESGEEYFSYNLYGSKSAARRMRAQICSLPWWQTRTYGLLTGPLSGFPLPPDLVLVFGSPYQIMRLVQGYEYATGKKPQLDTAAMQAVCTELTSGPLLRGEMNLSVLCPSTRMLCKWGEEEMGAALPFECFYTTVEGVFGTMETTDSKKKKIAAIQRFKAVGKTLDLDPDKGY